MLALAVQSVQCCDCTRVDNSESDGPRDMEKVVVKGWVDIEGTRKAGV